MTVKVRIGGEWKDITGAKVYKGGTWRTLVAIKAYVGGAWRDIANYTSGGGGGSSGSLSLSLNTTLRTKVGTSSTLTSLGFTVTPSGGLAPYSYAWSVVSSDGLATYTINSPTLSTTTVTASSLLADQTSEVVIHCAVTDSLGASATSANCTARFERTSLS
jgi:hypothetical protein